MNLAETTTARARSADEDQEDQEDGAGEDDPAMFATETMAELYARQGQVSQAVRIYRRLLAGDPPIDRMKAWSDRLGTLERAGARTGATNVIRPAKERAAAVPAAGPIIEPPMRLPLVVRTPVRSGQIVHAEGTDLIVLAPVNPGGQVVADGNIHVYAPLRGRAIAGARGSSEARIFCLRLEAELLAVNGIYATFDDLPPTSVGKAAQISLDGGRCVVTLL